MTSALLLTASSITLRNGACPFHANAPMDKHPTPRCNNQSHSDTPAVLNVAVSPTITVDPEQAPPHTHWQLWRVPSGRLVLVERIQRTSRPGQFCISRSPTPTAKDKEKVAALLRRVADTIDALGDVQVEDVTFKSEVTDGEDDLTVTVYYHAEPRRR